MELRIEHLTKKYKDFTALDDLSLCVKQGELFSLLGVNGAGKTTLSKLIMRLYDVTDGSIEIGSQNIKDVTSNFTLVGSIFKNVGHSPGKFANLSFFIIKREDCQ